MLVFAPVAVSVVLDTTHLTDAFAVESLHTHFAPDVTVAVPVAGDRPFKVIVPLFFVPPRLVTLPLESAWKRMVP
jgi:hypothetical protein